MQSYKNKYVLLQEIECRLTEVGNADLLLLQFLPTCLRANLINILLFYDFYYLNIYIIALRLTIVVRLASVGHAPLNLSLLYYSFCRHTISSTSRLTTE